jgi:hypothetical protein
MPNSYSQPSYGHPIPSPRRVAQAGHGAPAPTASRAIGQPSRLTLWPLEDGRYGLDAIFHGHWGCEDAEQHAGELGRRGIQSVIRPEADGGWTVRLGPLGSLDVARALGYLAR